jgi:CRISPR type III-B/RAMP module-associated protein Cmr5
MAETFTTPNQARSNYANRCVIAASIASNNESSKFSEYRNISKSAPSLIMQSGLLPALTYILSRGKAESKVQVGKDILKWLIETKHIKSDLPREAFAEIMALSAEGYMDATQEALELLTWLRQLSDFHNVQGSGDNK